MTEVFTRAMTINMMLDPGQGRQMLAMMGLTPVDFGPNVQAMAAAVMVALEAFE